MTDVVYTDYQALLANRTAQTESLLHSRKQTTGRIDFYLKANKTVHGFKQAAAISI